MRVEEVIQKSLEILSDCCMLKLNDNPLPYALFPASSQEERAHDAMEVCQSQRVKVASA
jgi:hypothetical protein